MSRDEFDKHFTPPYNPWEQRFCLAPGGDFFVPFRQGKASIVTDHIDHLNSTGIVMKSGQVIEADFIISATGLTMQQNFPFSTIKVKIDGNDYVAGDHFIYNGIMVNDVPNMGFVIGYTNASWTLKADIAAVYFSKLMNHMKKNNFVKVSPVVQQEMKKVQFTGGLSSGYFMRAGDVLPKQGDKYPWDTGANNYILDLLRITIKGICIDSLEFVKDEKKEK